MTLPLTAPAVVLVGTCNTCAATAGQCEARIFSLRQSPCCTSCTHCPELPHRGDDLPPHDPETCAAWADRTGSPRAVACEGHWLPSVVTARRAQDRAERAAAPHSGLPGERAFGPEYGETRAQRVAEHVAAHA